MKTHAQLHNRKAPEIDIYQTPVLSDGWMCHSFAADVASAALAVYSVMAYALTAAGSRVQMKLNEQEQPGVPRM